jgi:hypothetical protein
MKTNYSQNEAIKRFEQLVNDIIDFHDYSVNAEMTGHLNEALLSQMDAILEHMMTSRTLNHIHVEKYFLEGFNPTNNYRWQLDRYHNVIGNIDPAEIDERIAFDARA